MEFKLFKKEKKSAGAVVKHVPEIGERVFQDWKLMLLTFVLLLLVVVFCDGYLLLKINRGDFFVTETSSEVNPAQSNRKILIDATGFYEMRAKAYEASRTATSTEIDPSL